MIIPILYTLFITAYAVLPFLHKSKRPAMLRFYVRMAYSRSFRKCYTMAMLASLMVFHFYHLNVFGNAYELALSTAVCVFLYSHKNTERVFNFLQHKSHLFWSAMAAVALLFVPHLLPLGITAATVVFGAAFYPSRKVRNASTGKVEDGFSGGSEKYPESPHGIVNDYYRWH